jgi:hypothetical protein
MNRRSLPGELQMATGPDWRFGVDFRCCKESIEYNPFVARSAEPSWKGGSS